MLFTIALLIASQNPPMPVEGYHYREMSDEQILSLDCFVAGRDIDRFVAECFYEQSSIWRKKVVEEYKAALLRVDPEMRPHVEKAQRAWVKYRDAKCAQWDDTAGTLSVRRKSMCEYETDKLRAIELQDVAGFSG